MSTDSNTPENVVVTVNGNVATVVDAKSRRLTVQPVDALKFYRLAKVLGSVAQSEAATNLAVTAASVVQIDDDRVPFPSSEKELEALIQLLDFDGLKAAGAAAQALQAKAADGLDAVKN